MIASTEAKQSGVQIDDAISPKIFNIIGQNEIVGASRKHSVLATPDRLLKREAASNSALHGGDRIDLVLQFTRVNNIEDCTPQWVQHNAEIFAASFARKCLRNLFANKERKLNKILELECALQKDLRHQRKATLTGMTRRQRVEEKAKYRFLRTAVNSPSLPISPKSKNSPNADPKNLTTARMLISEFEILMRQFGVQITDRAQLRSLFETVKADKPHCNYITLEQFLAWYRKHSFPLNGTRRVTKWKSLSSGSYDVSMARLSAIQYCIQAALTHGRDMFHKKLQDYRELATSASQLNLPDSPKFPNPRRRLQFSVEQKVEASPTAYFNEQSAGDQQIEARLSVTMETEPTPNSSGILTPPTEESTCEESCPETDEEDGDLRSRAFSYQNSYQNSYQTNFQVEESDSAMSFDAAAYIEAACKEMLVPVPSADESDGTSDGSGEYDEPRASMSDGAKFLIDSLLVFSEDGMDEIANHIEANRNEDQLAEEEIENFIGNMNDQVMSSFAERLELGGAAFAERLELGGGEGGAEAYA